MKIGEKYNLGDGKIVEVTGFSDGMKMKKYQNGSFTEYQDKLVEWKDADGKEGKFTEGVFAKASTDLDPTITKCAYCGALNKKDDTQQATIISSNWASTGYKSPLRNYCKNKPCAGHDQMAHEG
jgi:hypothetical protein